MITDCPQLNTSILKKYFKHNNFSSLIRQLNIYNFHKVQTHQNQHYFHHKNFIKDRSDQYKLIRRKQRNWGKQKKMEILNKLVEVTGSEVGAGEASFEELRRENLRVRGENQRLREKLEAVKESSANEIQMLLNLLYNLSKLNSSNNFPKLNPTSPNYHHLQSLLHNHFQPHKNSPQFPISSNFQSILKTIHSLIAETEQSEFMLEEDLQRRFCGVDCCYFGGFQGEEGKQERQENGGGDGGDRGDGGLDDLF